MSTALQQFQVTFCDESLEALDAMETDLLLLDAGSADSATINTIFRHAHSIKGNAGMMGYASIASFTHTMESLLDQVRGQRCAFSQPIADALLMGVDVLRSMVADIRLGRQSSALASDVLREQLLALIDHTPALPNAALGPAMPRPAAAPAAAATGQWLIEFSARESLLIGGKDPMGLFADLSALGPLEVSADLTLLPPLAELDPRACYLRWELRLQSDAPKDSIELIFEWAEADCNLLITELPALVVSAGAAEGAAREPDGASVRVPLAKIDAVQATLTQVAAAEAALQSWLATLGGAAVDGLRLELSQLHLHLKQLQEDVRQLRMLPVGSVFERFPRLVRDASALLGKQIHLTTGGDQTELDRTILERLGDPLLHLVRNCIDHGIETPSQRLAAGKSVQGQVHIEVSASAGMAVIEVSDDGKGLDAARILDKARSRSLPQAQGELTQQQVHELIFLPGLSTVDVATDLSGRGVGMDIVRCNIEALGGSIELHSEPGKGTRFTLCVPTAADGQIMGEAVADGLLRLGCSV